VKAKHQVRRNGNSTAGQPQPPKVADSAPGKTQTVKEFKILRLRECPVDDPVLDNPPAVDRMWRSCVATAPHFDPERENMVVFALNTRHRVVGFQIISQGTLNSTLVRIPELFRFAAIQNAASIILAHNHPSGDPEPSEEDVRMTLDIRRAGDLMRIQILDHVVIGHNRYASLREHGHFYATSTPASSEKPKEKGAVVDRVFRKMSDRLEGLCSCRPLTRGHLTIIRDIVTRLERRLPLRRVRSVPPTEQRAAA
jgi:hypothetical protein